MKKLVLSALIGATTLIATAQSSWTIDAAHSSVNFKIEHLGIAWVSGNFASFSGSVNAEKEDFSDMVVSFTIESKTVNTGISDRDKHLTSDDFFKSEKYPTMTFKSKKIIAGKEGKISVEGEFTMLDKTLPLTLDAEFKGIAQDMYGQTKAGFTVKAIIDRYAYGVAYNAPLEAGGFLLGQNVHLFSFIELTKSK